jgi:hypothetical protein
MSRRILLFSISCFTVVTLVVALAWASRADATRPDGAAAAPETRLIDASRPVAVPHDAPLVERANAARRAAAERALIEHAAAALRPRTNVNWDAIARCETGGNWRMQGPRFSGGLGFANTTWNGFGGREFAPNAGMASREQQIVVAERVHDRYGLSGWGCKRFG